MKTMGAANRIGAVAVTIEQLARDQRRLTITRRQSRPSSRIGNAFAPQRVVLVRAA